MAVDMFLKLTGIKGESKDDKHKDEIHIESYSWGMSNSPAGHAGGGLSAGKVNIQDLSITKYMDKSSCDLMFHSASGKHIAEGLLTVRKAGEKPVEYLKIKLTDILISSVQQSGHGGGDLLSESVTLHFAKVNVDYQEQDQKGKGTPAGAFGWDIPANKKL